MMLNIEYIILYFENFPLGHQYRNFPNATRKTSTTIKESY